MGRYIKFYDPQDEPEMFIVTGPFSDEQIALAKAYDALSRPAYLRDYVLDVVDEAEMEECARRAGFEVTLNGLIEIDTREAV